MADPTPLLGYCIRCLNLLDKGGNWRTRVHLCRLKLLGSQELYRAGQTYHCPGRMRKATHNTVGACCCRAVNSSTVPIPINRVWNLQRVVGQQIMVCGFY